MHDDADQWYVNARHQVALFPEGNFEDYHLGYGAGEQNTMGQPGWFSAEEIVRQMRQDEIDGWTPDEDATIALIKNQSERGGGLIGASPGLAFIRAAMTAAGERAIQFENRLYSRQRGSSRI